MEPKKNPALYARPASKVCQSNERKPTDSQLAKQYSKNNKHREPNSTRNDSNRNQKQYNTNKTRPNFDKRPRQRGTYVAGSQAYGSFGDDISNCSFTSFTEDVATSSAGLAQGTVAAANATNSGAIAKQTSDRDLNIYGPGGKKQNLNHLLNFNYSSRETDYSYELNVFGRGVAGNKQRGVAGGAHKNSHKYNKEQFLQANFQFVIRESGTPKITASPDTLIDWEEIEQINVRSTEDPQCPICLYPPVAAKLTRCGHAYCWTCILHYLALSDKTWRKCPICYDAIHIGDLKSTAIIQQSEIKVGSNNTFHLMRRKKGSSFIERFHPSELQHDLNIDEYPLLSSENEAKLFSKFIVAKREDIVQIIDRELCELKAGADPADPEHAFVEQASLMLLDRRRKLMSETDVEAKKKNTTKASEIFKPIEFNVTVENKELQFSSAEEPIDEPNIDSLVLADTSETVAQKVDTGTIEDDAAAEVAEKVDNYATELEPVENETSLALNELAETVLLKIANNSKYYYFYQSADGQNIYLHPLNVKMLQACYGSLDRSPATISAKIVQCEQHFMDEEKRRKFTCLAHLPLTCQFTVIEVDMQPPIITDDILKMFKNDLLFRKKERQRRDREERKREKQINEINERQMGKIITSTMNINLNSSHEFPTFGFEEPLPTPTNSAKPNVRDATNTPGIPTLTHTNRNRQRSYSSVTCVGEVVATKTARPNKNFYQALSPWGKSDDGAGTLPRECLSGSADYETGDPVISSPQFTNLGDVVAEALNKNQRKNVKNGAGSVEPTNSNAPSGNAAGKKNKKSKKMQPLFATGINYNGN